jgi:tRNA pseudouridine65 synthase
MQNDETIEVLYQDSYLVAVNKPANLLVHKSPIDRKEKRFLLQIVRNQLGVYLYPVHRLDKPTSGIMLFALTKEVAKILSEAFQKGEISKEYIAIVRGYVEGYGTIKHALKEMLDTKVQKQRGITKEPQEALTHYKVLTKIELPYAVGRYATTRYSVVKLSPKTGRKHQLRRHMKHINHHIIGDTKHGRGEHNRFFREHFQVHRLLLHANSITFRHPISNEEIVLEAKPESHMVALLKHFGYDFLCDSEVE